MQNEYTEEQKKDIIERSQKALQVLKELELSIAANVGATNLGNDVFGLKVQPYIKDLKYETKPEKVAVEVEPTGNNNATVSPFMKQPE